MRIAPLIGNLQHFTAKAVHPKGDVEVIFDRKNGQFLITLPVGIVGVLDFCGNSYPLDSGKNDVRIAQ